MKLPIRSLDLNAQLAEFDVWLTPSLGEIRDTERFKEELNRVVRLFDALGLKTENFTSVASCEPTAVAEDVLQIIKGVRSETEAYEILISLASVLFLVTGKSDNNVKCQLPVYLNKQGWTNLPVIKRDKRGTIIGISEKKISRTLKAENYMSIVSGLGNYSSNTSLMAEGSGVYSVAQNVLFQEVLKNTSKDAKNLVKKIDRGVWQRKMLQAFIEFILSDTDDRNQFWSISHSYFALKTVGKEKSLLTPLVIFQVRGSVSATGGHGPEHFLRRVFAEWGLVAGVDFNLTDVVPSDSSLIEVNDEPDSSDMLSQESREDGITNREKEKKRGYDFVLPYRTPGWDPRIFVQSQFYAGDSGSVSHKNVDQASGSRQKVMKIFPDALFIEYVDGAGYFASLNSDLKKLFSMSSTASFIQIRSAVVRLRRELQQIGFLTPLEIEHALLRSSGEFSKVKQILHNEGYKDAEVTRCWSHCLDAGHITLSGDGFWQVNNDRIDLIRRYFILDIAANTGKPIVDEKLNGYFLIPGYGKFFGIKLDDLVMQCQLLVPVLNTYWKNTTTFLGDIRWLTEQEWAMSR